MRRITERFINGEWVECRFEDLVHRDIVRFVDNDVLYKNPDNGQSEFEVVNTPYLNEDGVWQVDIVMNK